MDELNEKFIEWHLQSGTHETRHMKIIEKQLSIARRWIDAVRKYPANSPEIVIEINSLWRELGTSFDELSETYKDMGRDCDKLIEFLNLLEEEVKKLHDTP